MGIYVYFMSIFCVWSVFVSLDDYHKTEMMALCRPIYGNWTDFLWESLICFGICSRESGGSERIKIYAHSFQTNGYQRFWFDSIRSAPFISYPILQIKLHLLPLF